MQRTEPYFQNDTISKWDVLTFFAATCPISRSSDIDTGRQEGGAALDGGGSVLIPVRGDVYNKRMFMAERLDVAGAHHLRSV